MFQGRLHIRNYRERQQYDLLPGNQRFLARFEETRANDDEVRNRLEFLFCRRSGSVLRALVARALRAFCGRAG
jgi:hypothetical protein